MKYVLLLTAVWVSLVGCGSAATTDAGVDAGHTLDAGSSDAGHETAVDAGNGVDAGSNDAGHETVADAGLEVDAGSNTAPVCVTYCANIMANCTGANAQYPSLDACLGSCAAMQQGTVGDSSGNTLACRAYHADAAASAAAVHCAHAGPGGAGVCGANCDGFCTIAVAKCYPQWPSFSSCQSACTAFHESSAAYNSQSASGNTFACRLYHLTVAATDASSAAKHCIHTPESSSVCQ